MTEEQQSSPFPGVLEISHVELEHDVIEPLPSQPLEEPPLKPPVQQEEVVKSINLEETMELNTVAIEPAPPVLIADMPSEIPIPQVLVVPDNEVESTIVPPIHVLPMPANEAVYMRPDAASKLPVLSDPHLSDETETVKLPQDLPDFISDPMSLLSSTANVEMPSLVAADISGIVDMPAVAQKPPSSVSLVPPLAGIPITKELLDLAGKPSQLLNSQDLAAIPDMVELPPLFVQPRAKKEPKPPAPPQFKDCEEINTLSMTNDDKPQESEPVADEGLKKPKNKPMDYPCFNCGALETTQVRAGPFGKMIEAFKTSTSKKSFEMKQPCTYCGTTTTPQVRHGPFGKSTLCNACGMKYSRGRLGANMPITEELSPMFVRDKVVRGPLGPGALCNKCGIKYTRGRLAKEDIILNSGVVVPPGTDPDVAVALALQAIVPLKRTSTNLPSHVQLDETVEPVINDLHKHLQFPLPPLNESFALPDMQFHELPILSEPLDPALLASIASSVDNLLSPPETLKRPADPNVEPVEIPQPVPATITLPPLPEYRVEPVTTSEPALPNPLPLSAQ